MRFRRRLRLICPEVEFEIADIKNNLQNEDNAPFLDYAEVLDLSESCQTSPHLDESIVEKHILTKVKIDKSSSNEYIIMGIKRDFLTRFTSRGEEIKEEKLAYYYRHPEEFKTLVKSLCRSMQQDCVIAGSTLLAPADPDVRFWDFIDNISPLNNALIKLVQRPKHRASLQQGHLQIDGLHF